MGRYHGRGGVLYLEIASGGSASPFPFLRNWSINQASNPVDVTAMGDPNQVFVAGLPGASGDFSFWLDDSTNQTYSGALDGIARKMYLYPQASSPTKYFWGTVIVDFSASASVDGAAEASATWSAASTISRAGIP